MSMGFVKSPLWGRIEGQQIFLDRIYRIFRIKNNPVNPVDPV